MLKVLAVLLEDPAGAWSAISLQQGSGVAAGSLYPVLIRFEAVGWLASRWEVPSPSRPDRPRRRLYQLTSAGRREAVDLSTTFKRGVFA